MPPKNSAAASRASEASEPPAQPFAFIRVLKDNGKLGPAMPLHSRLLTIGRKACDMTIELPTVSRKHAIIEVDESDVLWLTALTLNSKTRLNGEQLPIGESLMIRQGDVFEIGPRKFQVEYGPGMRLKRILYPKQYPLPARATPSRLQTPQPKRQATPKGAAPSTPAQPKSPQLLQQGGKPKSQAGTPVLAPSEEDHVADQPKEDGSENELPLEPPSAPLPPSVTPIAKRKSIETTRFVLPSPVQPTPVAKVTTPGSAKSSLRSALIEATAAAEADSGPQTVGSSAPSSKQATPKATPAKQTSASAESASSANVSANIPMKPSRLDFGLEDNQPQEYIEPGSADVVVQEALEVINSIAEACEALSNEARAQAEMVAQRHLASPATVPEVAPVEAEDQIERKDTESQPDPVEVAVAIDLEDAARAVSALVSPDKVAKIAVDLIKVPTAALSPAASAIREKLLNHFANVSLTAPPKSDLVQLQASPARADESARDDALASELSGDLVAEAMADAQRMLSEASALNEADALLDEAAKLISSPASMSRRRKWSMAAKCMSVPMSVLEDSPAPSHKSEAGSGATPAKTPAGKIDSELNTPKSSRSTRSPPASPLNVSKHTAHTSGTPQSSKVQRHRHSLKDALALLRNVPMEDNADCAGVPCETTPSRSIKRQSTPRSLSKAAKSPAARAVDADENTEGTTITQSVRAHYVVAQSPAKQSVGSPSLSSFGSEIGDLTTGDLTTSVDGSKSKVKKAYVLSPIKLSMFQDLTATIGSDSQVDPANVSSTGPSSQATTPSKQTAEERASSTPKSAQTAASTPKTHGKSRATTPKTAMTPIDVLKKTIFMSIIEDALSPARQIAMSARAALADAEERRLSLEKTIELGSKHRTPGPFAAAQQDATDAISPDEAEAIDDLDRFFDVHTEAADDADIDADMAFAIEHEFEAAGEETEVEENEEEGPTSGVVEGDDAEHKDASSFGLEDLPVKLNFEHTYVVDKVVYSPKRALDRESERQRRRSSQVFGRADASHEDSEDVDVGLGKVRSRQDSESHSALELSASVDDNDSMLASRFNGSPKLPALPAPTPMVAKRVRRTEDGNSDTSLTSNLDESSMSLASTPATPATPTTPTVPSGEDASERPPVEESIASTPAKKTPAAKRGSARRTPAANAESATQETAPSTPQTKADVAMDEVDTPSQFATPMAVIDIPNPPPTSGRRRSKRVTETELQASEEADKKEEAVSSPKRGVMTPAPKASAAKTPGAKTRTPAARTPAASEEPATETSVERATASAVKASASKSRRSTRSTSEDNADETTTSLQSPSRRVQKSLTKLDLDFEVNSPIPARRTPRTRRQTIAGKR